MRQIDKFKLDRVNMKSKIFFQIKRNNLLKRGNVITEILRHTRIS
jgi:hypothetical protein